MSDQIEEHKGLTCIHISEAPGASVKFNIPKRPLQVQCSPVSEQPFPPSDQLLGNNPTSSPAIATGPASAGAQTR